MKRFFAYLLALVVFGSGVWLALDQGRRLPAPAGTPPSTEGLGFGASTGAAPSPSLLSNVAENFQDPLTRLFVQLILIVLAARVCGWLAAKIGQPAVIGEMLAGIFLGPSLLGWLWPGAFHFIFPPASFGALRLLSQIGVCLFMFVVGMELDVALLKRQASTAVLVSQVSIFLPYLLGVLVSLLLYTSFAGPGTTFPAFALFVGISMSITAFPVLARILEERGLTRTPLGGTAIACAATDDVTAWSILAVVVAVAKATSVASAALSVGLVALYVAVMLLWIKPRMPRWFGQSGHVPRPLGRGAMAAVLSFLFASAFTTDVMGIHALFGSFLAGIVMPARAEFREFLRLRLEHFSSVFLLPLFFAFTGLRTQIGLLEDATAWLICLGLILTATLGKLGGAMFTARLTGVNWVDSFALGSLMNTRGLVELIALNIGYDLKIISPRLFTMLVIMALVTTFMTGPLLTLADHLRARRALASNPA